MHTPIPHYVCQEEVENSPTAVSKKLISSIRIYLLKQITPIGVFTPIIANIKSPTISNTRHFGSISSKKTPTPISHTSAKLRKGSDSSGSSAASLCKEQIPIKMEVFDKKQQRWAINNGITFSRKLPDSPKMKNTTQIKAAQFLRELSNSFKLSAKSALKSPSKINKYVMKQINDNLSKILIGTSPKKEPDLVYSNDIDQP